MQDTMSVAPARGDLVMREQVISLADAEQWSCRQRDRSVAQYLRFATSCKEVMIKTA